MSDVDIRQLAIVREAEAAGIAPPRRHILTRYVLPGVLVAGFLALIAWGSRSMILPERDVWVVPVLATQSAVQGEGTPLFQAAGWIEPRPTAVRVAALAPGVVERLLVVEDQPVKAGEAVAELVKDDAQLALERAQANLKLREAELAEAEAALQAAKTRFEQPVHLQAALGEAEAAVASTNTEVSNLPYEIRRAEAELVYAEKDYAGKQASEGAVSQRSIDQAKSALDAAQAMVEELKSREASLASQHEALVRRRDALKTQLSLLADEIQARDEAEAQRRAAAARVEQARVELAEAELRLERMTVRAPVDGRVYQLISVPGTTLSGGMGPLTRTDGTTVVTLYRPDMLQVRVDVRFEDIPKVAFGQPVEIDNPALSEPIAGKVLFISSEADIQKNTLQVKVAIGSAPDVFKPEMLVDVTFLAPKSADAEATASEELQLYLPQQLVQRDESGSFVWVADRSSEKAVKTPVTIGRAAAGGLVQVIGGLDASSRVIARGEEGLEDGMRIRINDEEPTFAAATSAPMADASQPLHRLPPGEGH